MGFRVCFLLFVVCASFACEQDVALEEGLDVCADKAMLVLFDATSGVAFSALETILLELEVGRLSLNYERSCKGCKVFRGESWKVWRELFKDAFNRGVRKKVSVRKKKKLARRLISAWGRQFWRNKGYTEPLDVEDFEELFINKEFIFHLKKIAAPEECGELFLKVYDVHSAKICDAKAGRLAILRLSKALDSQYDAQKGKNTDSSCKGS